VCSSDLSQAQTNVLNAVRTIQLELGLIHNSLEETTHRLAKQSDIVSSVNLIHTYEDPKKYQPLVFDAEKRALAQRLNQIALSGNFDLIGTYTPDGRITAFSIHHGTLTSPGYQTYLPSGEPRFTLVSETEPDDNPMLQFAPPDHLLFENTEPGVRAERIITQAVPGGILVDIITPILRERATGNVQNLGWLRTARILDNAFFANLGTHGGIDITLTHTDQLNTLTARFGANIPTLSLGADAPPAFAWGQDVNDFAAALQLPDAQSGTNVLIFTINKADLFAGLEAFRNAAAVVLFLAILIFVPLMLFFVRANITRPLTALVQSTMRIKDGARVTPAGTQRGDEIGTLAQAFDAMAETVQKRERELREKQGVLDGMVNNAPSLIQVKDTHGRYIMVNNRWEEFFGLKLNDVRGKTAEEILSGDTAELVHHNDELVRTSQTAHQFEEALTGAHSEGVFHSIKFPLLDDHGQVYGVCGISQDITERKQAEDRLRLTQRVVDETVEGIMITDGESRIVDVNPAFSNRTEEHTSELKSHHDIECLFLLEKKTITS